MRFMVIVKGNEETEAGAMPSEEILTEMGNYNQQLVDAGMMLAGEGLHPTSKGKKVKFSGDKQTVTDGPFAEAKEVIAGFWILQAKSWDEVIDWIKKAPMGGDTELEVRQVFEAEDFGDEFTPEARAQEARQREEMEKRQQ